MVRESANLQNLEPVIIDCGISVYKESKTRELSKLVGMSPRWLPKEYVLDSSVSAKTDVWSLACIMFFV